MCTCYGSDHELCPCTCIAVLLNDPRQNMENSNQHGESGTRPEISKHGSKISITGQINTVDLSSDH